jgi:iron complex outermembrane receptor protein
MLPAFAAATPINFDVPPQRAADALLAFSQQASVEVLFPADQLRSVQSAAVEGSFEPEAALARMLSPTGFYARRSTHGKFVVTSATEPTGTLNGRLFAPDGLAAAGIHVSATEARQTVETDATGAFVFDSLPPGTYRLIIESNNYRPIEVVGVRVDANRGRTLEPRTLQAEDGLVRLAPQLVEGKFFRRWGANDAEDFRPLRATGNLDLPRTADDALPFTIYDREQIARAGVVNLNEFLQRNVLDGNAGARPPSEQGGTDGQGNAASLYSTGSFNLRLRGYGADETIILVNGRRLPEIVTSGQAAAPPPPDVNFIPLSLVERVEVLPISASALYSGNPVGGVINIVLQRDVNATEVNTTYTNATHGFDAPQSTISLQHGESLLGGRLHLRLNATFTRSTPVIESELNYIGANAALTPPPPDRIFRATPNVRSANGKPLVGTQSFTSVAPGADGTTGMADFAGRDGIADLALFRLPSGIDNSPDSADYAYGRRQRGSSFFGSANYELFPWLEVGTDGIYTRTTVNRGYNVFPETLKVSAHSPFNPFHQDLNITLNDYAPLLGENYGEAQIDFYSAVVGLLVKMPGDWRASLDAQYGHSLTRYRGLAGVDSERWQQLVDAGAYNPLRDTQRYGPPQDFYDRALIYYGSRGKFVTLGDYDTLDTALRVTNRSLPLPTGSGAITVGGDYRSTQLARYTDDRRLGDGTLLSESLWSGRTLKRMSAFGELQAPLLPSKWLPHWIREIQTDLAARYVVSATAQESNLAPTGGVKIDFEYGFSLRGTIASSNRMPSPFLSRRISLPGVGDSGGEVALVSITDPVRQETYGGVAAADALNPNLKPEAAVTKTLGAIFQQGHTHQFRASVDFADTQKSLELSYLDPQTVMTLERLLPGRVAREPLAPGDAHDAGRVKSLVTGRLNLAHRHSQNWSTSVDYAWTECFGGRLDVYGRLVYFQRYDLQFLPTEPIIDELGAPDGLASALLKYRLNFGSSWSNQHYGFGWDGHYFGSRRLPPIEWATQHNRQINPYWQFDAFVQTDLARWLPWKVTRFGLHGQLRVNNVLDARPPRYASDPSGSGYQSYGDWRRQNYAVSVQATF